MLTLLEDKFAQLPPAFKDEAKGIEFMGRLILKKHKTSRKDIRFTTHCDEGVQKQ